MREVNGCHWPNSRFYNLEQCLRAVGLLGCVTVLHTTLVDDPLLGSHSDDENENTYLKLREGFTPQGIPPAPERLIHVRCYHPHSLSVEPRGYAEHIVNLLANWKGSRTHKDERRNLWNDPFLGVSSANELNLHTENGDANAANQGLYQTVAHYDRIMAWDAAFWKRVDELVPTRKALRIFPAFAYGHEPPGTEPGSEYAIPSVRAGLAASDIIASHPYGHLDWANGKDTVPGGKDAYWHMLCDFRPKGHKNANDPGGLYAQVTDKPFILTESGTFTHADKAKTDVTFKAMLDLMFEAERTNRCLGVTWFIWNSDGAHQSNEIWRNENLRGLLEHAPRYTVSIDVPAHGAPPVDPPKPPIEEPPMAFNPDPNGYIPVEQHGFAVYQYCLKHHITLWGPEFYESPECSRAYTDAGILVYHAPEGVQVIPLQRGQSGIMAALAETRDLASPKSPTGLTKSIS